MRRRLEQYLRAAQCQMSMFDPTVRSLGGRSEDELGELEEGLFPVIEIMGVFIHMPYVRNVILLQVGVNPLTDANQPILIAAREVEEFQKPGGLFRIRNEFGTGLCVWGRGESTDPGESIEVPQTKV